MTCSAACVRSLSLPKSQLLAEAANSYYAKEASRYFDLMGWIGNTFDYLLCAISSIGTLISSVYRSQGKDAPEGSTNLANHANTGRVMVSCVRSLQSVESLVTGKWLLSRDAKTGKALTHLNSDGKRVSTFKHPFASACSLSLIAGRLMSFVNTLHNFKIADLGRHARPLGHAVTAAYTAVVAFGLIESIRGFTAATTRDQLQGATLELVENVAYTAIHLPECGIGMAATAAPGLGIGMSILSAVGSVVIVAINVLGLKGFSVDPDA